MYKRQQLTSPSTVAEEGQGSAPDEVDSELSGSPNESEPPVPLAPETQAPAESPVTEPTGKPTVDPGVIPTVAPTSAPVEVFLQSSEVPTVQMTESQAPPITSSASENNEDQAGTTEGTTNEPTFSPSMNGVDVSTSSPSSDTENLNDDSSLSSTTTDADTSSSLSCGSTTIALLVNFAMLLSLL